MRCHSTKNSRSPWEVPGCPNGSDNLTENPKCPKIATTKSCQFVSSHISWKYNTKSHKIMQNLNHSRVHTSVPQLHLLKTCRPIVKHHVSPRHVKPHPSHHYPGGRTSSATLQGPTRDLAGDGGRWPCAKFHRGYHVGKNCHSPRKQSKMGCDLNW